MSGVVRKLKAEGTRYMTWVREHRIHLDDPEDRGAIEAALRRSRIPQRFWNAQFGLVKGKMQKYIMMEQILFSIQM